MSAIIDVFRVQPFNLEPVYAAWTDAPRFRGSKKDLPIDDWLAQIKQGCRARKVPKESWHRVGMHFLDGKARTRFAEVQKVMDTMHGGKFSWTWKSFKVAMRNMGWDSNSDKTAEIEVQRKSSGLSWIVGLRKTKDSDEEWTKVSPPPTPPSKPTPQRTMSWDVPSFKSMIPAPKRSNTTANIPTVSAPKHPPRTPSASSVAGPAADGMTTIAQAPVWLLNACTSLDFLTGEHPKVMTALSAILITVGSIPALPAISAGAGGAFLASGTAHALGSIAVGLGTLLQMTGDGKVQTQGPGQNAHR